MPEPYESIDFCYMTEYRTMLREAVIRGMPDNYKGPAQNPYTVSLVQPGVGHGNGYTLDEYDDDFFARFTRQEEPRDRKLVFRCTKSELDAIKRYANMPALISTPMTTARLSASTANTAGTDARSAVRRPTRNMPTTSWPLWATPPARPM